MPPLYPPDAYPDEGYGSSGFAPAHPAHLQGHSPAQLYQRNAHGQDEYATAGSGAMYQQPQQSSAGYGGQQPQQPQMPFAQTPYSLPQFYDQRQPAYHQSPPGGMQMNYHQNYQAPSYMHMSPQQQQPSTLASRQPYNLAQPAPAYRQSAPGSGPIPVQRSIPTQQQFYPQHATGPAPQQSPVQYAGGISSLPPASARAPAEVRAPSLLLQQQLHHHQSPRLSDQNGGQLPQLLASPASGSPAQIHTQSHQRPSFPYPSQGQPSPMLSHTSTPIHAQRLSASPAQRHSPQVAAQPLERVSTNSPSWGQHQHRSQGQSPALAHLMIPQHRVGHVDVPVQRTASSEYGVPAPMMPPAKRRKSNDVAPIPVYDSASTMSQQAHATSLPGAVAPMPPPSSLTELASSQIRPPSPPAPSVDYQAVLLSLSDEYIKAAFSMSTSLSAVEVPEDRLDEYHGYLATGMSCLESVLKNYRITEPRKEARIRLRLANLMHEEAENVMEAEALLSKGISLCEGARLTNLKYAMQHLLARIWFKGKQAKFAMKNVDKLIDEVEKLQLLHWVYAFRFLRVSFGLQAQEFHVELGSLVKNIAAVVATADAHHDVAVHIVASAMEALIHLRSRAADGVDQAQRALAAARSHQLSPEMEDMPQVRALLNAIDLACNLVRFTPDQVAAHLSALRHNLDAYYEDSGQSKEGSWLLSLTHLPSSSKDIEADTGGIMKETPTGDCGLSLTWLTRTQATTVGFLLSALTGMQKSSAEQKTENTLREGINLNKVAPEQTHLSLSSASAHADWRHRTKLLLQTYAVFACCGRSDWESAIKGIANVRKSLYRSGTAPDDDTLALVAYLEATCKHGLGDLSGALHLYRSKDLQLPVNLDSKAFSTTGSAPIKLLAALNSVPILRRFNAGQEADELMDRLESSCLVQSNGDGNEHGNKAMESAFYVLKATQTDMTIIKTKQYIQYAIQAAQRVTNDRLLTIVMNQMTHLFFANIVGRQAEQSAKVGRTLAKKSGDRLWTAVADGMMSDTLEKSGNIAEADNVRQEGYQAMASLPASLKTALFAEPQTAA